MKSDSSLPASGKKTMEKHGFTLLELLLAIFIFSIVITTVYGSYRSTFHNIQSADYQAESEGMARVILERIQADLESTFGGDGGFMEGEQVDMDGMRGDRLSYTSTAHIRFSRNMNPVGVTVLTYSTAENEETGLLDLFRLDQPIRPTGEGEEEEEPQGELLGSNLKGFRITYITDDEGELESWQSETDEAESGEEEADILLPAMIRVELRFGEPDGDGIESTDRLFRTGVAILPGRAVST